MSYAYTQPTRLAEITKSIEELKKQLQDRNLSDLAISTIESEINNLSTEVAELLKPLQAIEAELKQQALVIDRIAWLRNKAEADSKVVRKQPNNLRGYIHIDQQEIKEISYFDKLSPKERDWYNRFLDNYYNARFKKDGKDIITDKNEQRIINSAKSKRRDATFENKGIRSKLESDQTATQPQSKTKPRFEE